jgi:hypothetical protein
MAVVGSLVVQVKAEAKGVRPGMQSATNQMNTFTRNTEKGRGVLASFGMQANKTGGILSRLAGPLAAVVTAGLALRHFRSEAERLDKIGKISIRLGIGVEELSGLQFAAEQSGIAVAQFNMGLQRMTRRMSEAANGTGEAKDAIKELGLDAKQLRDAGPGEALLQVADALARIKNPTDRLRLAFKLFDSEGVSMLQLFSKGRAGLEEMLDKAREVGATVDREMVDRFTEMNDRVNEMKTAWSAMAREIESTVAPVVTALSLRFLALARVIERIKEGGKRSSTEVVGIPREVQERFATQQGKDALARVRREALAERAVKEGQRPGVDISGVMGALQKRAQVAQEKIRGNAEKFLESLEKAASSASRSGMSSIDRLKQQTGTLGKLLLSATISQNEYSKAVANAISSYKLARDAQQKVRADQIRLANETPLEAARRKTKDIASLVGSGALGVGDAAREMLRIRKEFLDTRQMAEPPQAVGALSQGSAAAFSRIMELERGGEQKRQAQDEREKQTDWLQKANEWLERIAGKLEAGKV